MAATVTLQELIHRGRAAEKLVTQLRTQVDNLRKVSGHKPVSSEETKLMKENEELKKKVTELKQKLISIEVSNGIKQVPLPGEQISCKPMPLSAKAAVFSPSQSATDTENKNAGKSPSDGKKSEKPGKKSEKPKEQDDNLPMDVSRLDMRVGKIVDVKRHPDAESLYVEQVDLGEQKPRTIVSGLVKSVPIEEMQDRLAIFMVNLKPAKLRGILSEGMIMCGNEAGQAEIIDPPEGAKIGDKVTVPGYPGTPDSILNPKKKIFEQVQPDLRIDDKGAATYKGSPWRVGNIDKDCTVPTMKDKIIK